MDRWRRHAPALAAAGALLVAAGIFVGGAWPLVVLGFAVLVVAAGRL